MDFEELFPPKRVYRVYYDNGVFNSLKAIKQISELEHHLKEAKNENAEKIYIVKETTTYELVELIDLEDRQ